MGNINDQFNFMRDMAINDEQVKAINGAQNLVNNVSKEIHDKFVPRPELSPTPKTSSGGGLGGLLLAGAVVAGGAYLLSKVFGSSDDKQKNNDKTINNSKQDASSCLKRGNTYLNQQKYELAIQEFSKAIQISPNYALAYKGRGRCYQALGDNKNAQADFSKAKKLKKKG